MIEFLRNHRNKVLTIAIFTLAAILLIATVSIANNARQQRALQKMAQDVAQTQALTYEDGSPLSFHSIIHQSDGWVAVALDGVDGSPAILHLEGDSYTLVFLGSDISDGNLNAYGIPQEFLVQFRKKLPKTQDLGESDKHLVWQNQDPILAYLPYESDDFSAYFKQGRNGQKTQLFVTYVFSRADDQVGVNEASLIARKQTAFLDWLKEKGLDATNYEIHYFND